MAAPGPSGPEDRAGAVLVVEVAVACPACVADGWVTVGAVGVGVVVVVAATVVVTATGAGADGVAA